MSMGGLRALPDGSAGNWIASRLRGFGSTVACTVPTGFAAYARILHPVDFFPAPPSTSSAPASASAASAPAAEGPVAPTGTAPHGLVPQRAGLTWAQVCQRTGRTPHALMQWRSIGAPALASAGSELQLPVTDEGLWEEVSVQEGTLEPAALSALLEVLAPFTGEQECCHALWEGYGWLTGSSAFIVFASADSEGGPPPLPPKRAEMPRELQQALAAPRLTLPGRYYLLFAGPLRAALDMGDQVTDDWFDAQSPNLLWPLDRSWCLASEIDFDSTLIGGSAELIKAVLAAPGLEAWQVTEDDDLGLFADTLNT
ncbi:hypothetical protein [Kineococcus indalonis]|uniref:hypothetical protein n=1 Tax=Kineococcus indalonis TaxID=2696566 RepID=UPI001412363C|nr:hypothetical protein [Kineococcus indalonis]NAZ86331.1 hypothetical protein [Kineococcus indalonis]